MVTAPSLRKRSTPACPFESNAATAQRPLAIGHGPPLFPPLATGWMEALADLPNALIDA